MSPIFVSVKEAARILGLGTWSVYKLLDNQAIAGQYQGAKRLVRYRWDDHDPRRPDDLPSLIEYARSLPTEASKADEAS